MTFSAACKKFGVKNVMAAKEHAEAGEGSSTIACYLSSGLTGRDYTTRQIDAMVAAEYDAVKRGGIWCVIHHSDRLKELAHWDTKAQAMADISHRQTA